VSTSLNCPSCGAGVSPDGSAAYVTCEYCKTSISVAEFFRESSTNTIQYLADAGLSEEESKKVAKFLEGATLFVNSGEYLKAKQKYEEVLALAPGHLPSRFNLALCELYSGKETPLARAKTAVNIVNAAAASHQMIPELLSQKESIAYNIASVGLGQMDVFDTIKFIQLSKSIVTSHAERDELIANFFANIEQKQRKIVLQEIKVKGKKYSPSRTLLELILAGSPYCPNLADLGATLLLYLHDEPTSVNSKIKDILGNLHKTVLTYCHDEIASINFGFFGYKMLMVSKKKLEAVSF
jgi:hypothetical protein